MSLPQSSSNISRGVVPGSDDEEDYDSDRVAADDEALEAKERRLEKITKEDTEMGDDEPIAFSNDIHGNILRGLHEEKEEGGGKNVQKVLNAVKRTEALNMGSRWYFFETEEIPTVKRQPFPKASVLKNWKNDLAEPRVRHQTFVSGFAENMVAYGNTLPDEIIKWILDDFSYASALTQKFGNQAPKPSALPSSPPSNSLPSVSASSTPYPPPAPPTSTNSVVA
ncbi:hypothetical protein DID88_006719 [Monilinia fructigena]|uniref:Uncharacterized protein n=1 Tax=Monilinia fructigena TaxID=38457 RepID=A0A395III8_9HELO|nr:hypothetical protein DID88_006719 [Monilinia fructigena]